MYLSVSMLQGGKAPSIALALPRKRAEGMTTFAGSARSIETLEHESWHAYLVRNLIDAVMASRQNGDVSSGVQSCRV